MRRLTLFAIVLEKTYNYFDEDFIKNIKRKFF